MSRKKVFVVCGPTAVGKTAIAIALAQKLPTEIVSADSRQCYSALNIGVSRPSTEELLAVRHHFIAEYPLRQNLTAADFEKIALEKIAVILENHDYAIVCGGTGLYIKALCDGLDEMPEVREDIVEEVESQYLLHGFSWLLEALKAEDPAFFEAGEIQNPSRMLRALSFIRSTGSSILGYRTFTKKDRIFDIIKIGLDLPRPVLYDRINRRVDIMIAAGQVAEAERLYPFRHFKNLQTVSYSELFEYFDGKLTLKDAIDKIKQHTRNYAKRQLTWFRKEAGMHWFMADDPDLIEKIIVLN